MACVYPSQSASLDVRSRYSVCQAQFWVKHMECRPHGFSPRRSPAEGVGRVLTALSEVFAELSTGLLFEACAGVETALPIERCQPVTMNSPSLTTHTDTHKLAHTPTASHLSKPGCGPWSCHTAGTRSPHMMCQRNAERGRNSSALCSTVSSERQVEILHLI